MQNLFDGLQETYAEATKIWSDGGWAMIAIAAIAMAMFGMGVLIHFRLGDTGFRRLPEREWRKWVVDPSLRRGRVGAYLTKVGRGGSLHELSERFEAARAEETRPFERDLAVMKVCVSAAPLVGLLGTVTGMLATFAALSSGSGGDQTMGRIAEGISEALVTTETGLVVALPGLFFHYLLSRRYERYKAFLTHVQTVCMQTTYRRAVQRTRGRAPRLATTLA